MKAGQGIIEKVKNTIIVNKLIEPNDIVIVGVSGGADSMCLLDLLHSLIEQLHFTIRVVHVNHCLRGKEADKDEEYVLDFCQDRGIEVNRYTYDIFELAKQNGVSEEEAGRDARYEAFAKTAKEYGGTKIAVAHNRNDQAETVFLNILRGTGLEGLSGMDFKRGNIIRPLLDIDRDQIEEYCTEHNIKPRIDSTNLECLYTRNKVRLNLFPYIRENFGIDITDSLCRLTKLVANDKSFINAFAEISLDNSTVEDEQNIDKNSIHTCDDQCIRLNVMDIKDMHPAIATRVLRKAISKIKGNIKGIELVHIDMVMTLITSGRNGAIAHLPGGVRARLESDSIEFYLNGSIKEKAHKDQNETLVIKELGIPGLTYAEELGIRIEAKVINRAESCEYERKNINIYNETKRQFALFDYDVIKKTHEKLVVRNRRQGDIFKPNKSSGTKKIKEYFIEKKISAQIRGKIPLIALGKEILWIIGNKTSDKFVVSENTNNVLLLFVVF